MLEFCPRSRNASYFHGGLVPRYRELAVLSLNSAVDDESSSRSVSPLAAEQVHPLCTDIEV